MWPTREAERPKPVSPDLDFITLTAEDTLPPLLFTQLTRSEAANVDATALL